MGEFTNILSGMLGLVVRTILNKMGSDISLSRRQVSAFSEIENEINYFKAGTVISTNDGAVYSFDGNNWNLVYAKPDVDYVKFNIAVTPPSHQEGVFYWDAVEHTLSMMTEISGTELQLGQEFFVRIINKTGELITDGSVVYISGAQGNRPTATLAIATDISADKIIGVATSDIADNEEGYVTTKGIVRGYNTSGFGDGDILYVSESVAGGLQNTPPLSPNHAVKVGIALNSTVSGSIYVSIEIGGDISSLHDVNVSSPTCGSVLKYDEDNSTWINSQQLPIVKKTEDYLVVRNDISDGTILVECSSSDITITLPSLSDSKNISLVLAIKKVDATGYSVIIDGNGYNIDGQSSKSLSSQYETIRIHSDSSGWWII